MLDVLTDVCWYCGAVDFVSHHSRHAVNSVMKSELFFAHFGTKNLDTLHQC